MAVSLNIKAQKGNLNELVREALTIAGYSHYKVLNQVNAMLGELKGNGKPVTVNTGDFKLKGKKSPNYTVSVKVGTVGFSQPEKDCEETIVHEFTRWHDSLNAADSWSFTVTIPDQFKSWLDKFAKADKKEPVAPVTA